MSLYPWVSFSWVHVHLINYHPLLSSLLLPTSLPFHLHSPFHPYLQHTQLNLDVLLEVSSSSTGDPMISLMVGCEYLHLYWSGAGRTF